MSEETREPRRTIPRAILLAMAAVTAIYVLTAYAALRAPSPDALAASPRPLAAVYEAATGDPAWFIAAIGVAAALNRVLAQIVMAARVLYGLGRRTAVFAAFARVHPRFRTPFVSAKLCGAIVVALALTAPLPGLASAKSFALILVFVAMNVGLILLTRRGPPPEGAPDLPIWSPALGAVASLGVLVGALLEGRDRRNARAGAAAALP